MCLASWLATSVPWCTTGEFNLCVEIDQAAVYTKHLEEIWEVVEFYNNSNMQTVKDS